MAEGVILELNKSSPDYSKVVEDVVRIEKKIFVGYNFSSRSLEEELSKKNSGLHYVLVNEEVAGYVMYSWTSSLVALIMEIAVEEKYRKQGYGEALMRAAFQKCQTMNIQRISLHVAPSSTAALNLYKKLQFRTDSLLPKFYSADGDAYVALYLIYAPWVFLLIHAS